MLDALCARIDPTGKASAAAAAAAQDKGVLRKPPRQKRAPSAYNLYVREKMAELKAEGVPVKQRMSTIAAATLAGAPWTQNSAKDFEQHTRIARNAEREARDAHHIFPTASWPLTLPGRLFELELAKYAEAPTRRINRVVGMRYWRRTRFVMGDPPSAMPFVLGTWTGSQWSAECRPRSAVSTDASDGACAADIIPGFPAAAAGEASRCRGPYYDS